MARNFGHGKRLYIIETDFGTIRGVTQDEAELFEHINVGDREFIRHTIRPQSLGERWLSEWAYVPMASFAISCVLGLAIWLFR